MTQWRSLACHARGVQVYRVADAAVTAHQPDELPRLLAEPDGFVWVDIASCDEAAAEALTTIFGCHPMAVERCRQRNRIPRVHVYPEHRFYVLHVPERGVGGHVHYVELDQIVGANYLVTVHGPANDAVPPAVLHRETGAVLERLRSGRMAGCSPPEVAYAITSAVVRTMEEQVAGLTEEIWGLEQRLTSGKEGPPEQFLEELFRARHGLLAVRTMASNTREIYVRAGNLGSRIPEIAIPYVQDLADQFDRCAALAQGQWEYLQGVIDYFRARNERQMSIATERLAVIAAVTLPVTALASIYGMNIIVNGSTQWFSVLAVLLAMSVISTLLLRWARRQGWW